MFDRSDIFSDVFAHKENLITGIEARTKIAFTVIALLINLLSPSVYTPIAIAVFCLATLVFIRVPPRLLLLRLTMPLLMAAVVLITQLFFYGTTPLFTVPFLGVVGYEEGLVHGLLIMCRVIGGVSLILFLGMSTPAHKLLLAARWFRLPKVFIELSLLIYRYIFVLIEEAIAVKDAQRVRLGYRSWRQGMRSVGTLGGILVLRAYDRAERVFAAMIARGYSGAISVNYAGHFGGKDFVAAVGLGGVLTIIYLVGWLRA
jgi:cobalt/nickel transport system permease protein